MSSDAQWMTVKFDLGENQNNINKFQSIIERLATMDEMQKQAQSQGEVQKLFGKNVKFTNEELGDIEIKYLSWGDAKKVATAKLHSVSSGFVSFNLLKIYDSKFPGETISTEIRRNREVV